MVGGNVRGKQLEKKKIKFVIDHAILQGVMKVILDCSDENRAFDGKLWLQAEECKL